MSKKAKHFNINGESIDVAVDWENVEGAPDIPSAASEISTDEGISDGKNVQADLTSLARKTSNIYEDDEPTDHTNLAVSTTNTYLTASVSDNVITCTRQGGSGNGACSISLKGLDNGVTYTMRVKLNRVLDSTYAQNSLRVLDTYTNTVLATLDITSTDEQVVSFAVSHTDSTVISVGENYRNSEDFIITVISIIDATEDVGERFTLSMLKDISQSNIANEYKVYSNLYDGKPTSYQGDEICIFNKILCIGDSLTAGVFNASGSQYITIDRYSYPAQLAKITGCEVTNMGIGGYTTQQWYDAKSSADLSGYDCVIIQLGVNDALQSVDDDTYKTYLGKIIDKVVADNNRVSIFVASIIPATSYSGTAYDAKSAAVRDLVSSRTDCHLVDLAQYGNTKSKAAYNRGHLSVLGYNRLARDYKAYIGYIIRSNLDKFANVQFANTDYTPIF